jgi:hypothetical protein
LSPIGLWSFRGYEPKPIFPLKALKFGFHIDGGVEAIFDEFRLEVKAITK